MAKRGRPKGSKNKKRIIRVAKEKVYRKQKGWVHPEESFWSKVVRGLKNFLKSPWS